MALSGSTGGLVWRSGLPGICLDSAPAGYRARSSRTNAGNGIAPLYAGAPGSYRRAARQRPFPERGKHNQCAAIAHRTLWAGAAGENLAHRAHAARQRIQPVHPASKGHAAGRFAPCCERRIASAAQGPVCAGTDEKQPERRNASPLFAGRRCTALCRPHVFLRPTDCLSRDKLRSTGRLYPYSFTEYTDKAGGESLDKIRGTARTFKHRQHSNRIADREQREPCDRCAGTDHHQHGGHGYGDGSRDDPGREFYVYRRL